MSKRGNGWKAAKEKRDGGAFVPIPMSVLMSKAFIEASPHAVKLLMDMLSQYRGNNNGDLCAAWRIMQPRGWKSQETLMKARGELVELGLIAETRKGARPNKASLYGLTWIALDDCDGKLDIDPRAFPRGAYRLRDAVPAVRPRKADHATLRAVK